MLLKCVQDKNAKYLFNNQVAKVLLSNKTKSFQIANKHPQLISLKLFRNMYLK